MKGFDVVIIGGGTAGICAAARIKRSSPKLSVTIIEPSGNHFYQPAFTFIAAGLMNPQHIARPMSDVIPEGCAWIRDTVSVIDAEQNQIHLSGGEKILYKALIVAPGLSVDFESIAGLPDALNDRRHPVCSIYDTTNLKKFSELFSQFIGGTVVFSMPSGPLKCPSASLKIMILADDLLRKAGVREVTRMIYVTPYSSLFAVDGFSQTMTEVVRKREIDVLFEHEIAKIDLRNQTLHVAPSTEAAAQRNIKTIKYDLAHVTPRMKAPQMIAESNLHHQDGYFQNWMNVDPQTLQHQKFINIFAAGDVAGLPTMKTATGARAQAEVVAENICFLFKKGAQAPLPRKYDGYTCCPLITEIGRIIHPELGYEGKLLSKIPLNPFVPRKSLWVYNTSLLPKLYWNFMLKGLL